MLRVGSTKDSGGRLRRKSPPRSAGHSPRHGRLAADGGVSRSRALPPRGDDKDAWRTCRRRWRRGCRGFARRTRLRLVAVRDGRALCFWPGPLALAARQEGSFLVRGLSDRRQIVRLPGATGAGHKPYAWVESPRRSSRDGVPVLDLPAGSQRIEGRFTWASARTIAGAAGVRPAQLTLDGKPLTHPKRDESGSLWLRTGRRTGCGRSSSSGATQDRRCGAAAGRDSDSDSRRWRCA